MAIDVEAGIILRFFVGNTLMHGMHIAYTDPIFQSSTVEITCNRTFFVFFLDVQRRCLLAV